jgi:two-component SAPR family response regulator
MESRILILGKEAATLDNLANNLGQFNLELIQLSSEDKVTELLQQKLHDLIIIDTSFSLEERKNLLIKIDSLNKQAAFHLVSRQEQFAVRDMVSFVKASLNDREKAEVGKLMSIQQTL